MKYILFSNLVPRRRRKGRGAGRYWLQWRRCEESSPCELFGYIIALLINYWFFNSQRSYNNISEAIRDLYERAEEEYEKALCTRMANVKLAENEKGREETDQANNNKDQEEESIKIENDANEHNQDSEWE